MVRTKVLDCWPAFGRVTIDVCLLSWTIRKSSVVGDQVACDIAADKENSNRSGRGSIIWAILQAFTNIFIETGEHSSIKRLLRFRHPIDLTEIHISLTIGGGDSTRHKCFPQISQCPDPSRCWAIQNRWMDAPKQCVCVRSRHRIFDQSKNARQRMCQTPQC